MTKVYAKEKIDKLDFLKMKDVVHQRTLPREQRDNPQTGENIRKSCI